LNYSSSDKKIAGSISNSSAADLRTSQAFLLPFENWVHVVWTKTASEFRLYINGNLSNSKNYSGNLPTSNDDLYFGYNPVSGYPYYVNGKLDDIGIWNRALTPQEISNLYNAGPFDVSATNTTICAGQPTTLSVQSITGTITALNCASSTNTGILTSGTAASGVSSTVPYTGGNGGTHNGQTVTSTGVTGLTATLTAGTFTSGNESLTYTISGTPSASGTASFALNIGGQTCTLNVIVYGVQPAFPTGTVYCNSIVTIVNNVTNPTTGKTWMDRNLGATQVATSSTDAAAYGDIYQWGRGSDGHQCRNSATTTTLSSTDQPSHGNFIITSTSPNDWRSPQNTNLWQGVYGVNKPCPSGYRLPTETELNAERLSWSSNNSAGAFASPLKLPMAGFRSFSNGSLYYVGTHGDYCSSTVSSTFSRHLYYSSSLAVVDTSNRADGRAVRCLKD
jgi:hypothetical protein